MDSSKIFGLNNWRDGVVINRDYEGFSLGGCTGEIRNSVWGWVEFDVFFKPLSEDVEQLLNM